MYIVLYCDKETGQDVAIAYPRGPFFSIPPSLMTRRSDNEAPTALLNLPCYFLRVRIPCHSVLEVAYNADHVKSWKFLLDGEWSHFFLLKWVFAGNEVEACFCSQTFYSHNAKLMWILVILRYGWPTIIGGCISTLVVVWINYWPTYHYPGLQLLGFCCRKLEAPYFRSTTTTTTRIFLCQSQEAAEHWLKLQVVTWTGENSLPIKPWNFR